jgi:rRNA maturation protein Nop10
MILKKCPECKKYTLFNKCKDCGTETKSAHYKYNGLRDAPKRFKNTKRKL